MTKSYGEFASENLAGFGWQLAPEDIPEYAVGHRVMQAIGDWWDGLDETTRNVVRPSDISVGLADAGFLREWSQLKACFEGNAFGTFYATWNDIAASLERANHAVHEQPQGLPDGTGIEDVTGA